jgi:site-specific DNA recombinase
VSEANHKLLRCAVYTRKSSSEGLEQAYNTLRAQRDACEAYIHSQRHEGWLLVDAAYDDGGFSGGNMERPGLKALLQDIRAGEIDVVVVYKIDRLTRSLLDFCKIIEVLDASGASFVAVTQSFNTTTSMGRLTLNVLLSFAQFEREITGERIRDKLASTRAKGMWIGATPPLGYDRNDGALIVNHKEAATVRALFKQYLKHQSIPHVVRYATEHQLHSKGSTGQSAILIGHASLCGIITNPVYIGKIRHRGAVLDGLHQGIIAPADFEKAGRMLQAHRGWLAAQRSPPPIYLLEGLLRSSRGDAYCGKQGQGRRYRRLSYQLPDTERSWIGKIQTASLDLAVIETLRMFLETLAATSEPPAAKNIRRIVTTLQSTRLIETHAAIRDVVDYVTLNEAAMTLTIRVRASPLAGALAEDTDIVASIARRRTNTGNLVTTESGIRAPDLAMVKFLGRGMRWFDELLSDPNTSVKAIAGREGFSPCYVGNTMELAFLAPDLKREILEGRHPLGLTARTLQSICPLPFCWDKQRELINLAIKMGNRPDRRALTIFKGPMVRRAVPWREGGGLWPRADTPKQALSKLSEPAAGQSAAEPS